MTTLLLGPSLGTSVASCWGPTLAVLRESAPDLHVVGLELPGHGDDPSPAPAGLTIADLARRALDLVDGSSGAGPLVYAGDSVGGQVGLQLLLDAPDRVRGAVLCCTGARIGDADTWTTRVAQVRESGTAGLVEATAGRWFGPGFREREPAVADALLDTLRRADDDGYVAVCGALAAYDARDRLGEITAPVVAVGGAEDPVCPPASLREIADGVRHGRLVLLDGVSHQAPAEAPRDVAAVILELVATVEEQSR